MKWYLMFSLFLLSSSLVCGQSNFDKVFYNADWKMVAQQDAVYYRQSGFDKVKLAFADTVKDYYLSNNQIEMTGFYKDGKKEGLFTYFFPNGKVRMISGYKGGERVGRWVEYNQDGSVRTELKYMGDMELIIALNDNAGKSVIEKTKFSIQLPYREPSTGALKRLKELQVDGRVVDQKRHGEWTLWDRDQVYSTLTYKEGTMISGFRYRKDTKVKLYSKNEFLLIPEPDKFYLTEKLAKQEGAVIANNYVLQGIYENTYLSMEPFEMTTFKQLSDYIYKNFDLRSRTRENKLKILISANQGLITNCSTEPEVDNSVIEDLELILKPVSKLTFTSDSIVVVDYTIPHDAKIGK